MHEQLSHASSISNHELRATAFYATMRESNFGDMEVLAVQWQEVRTIYPDQYVQLQILSSHMEGNMKYVDDVALIRAIADPKEATEELLRSKDGVIVSHTSNEELKLEVRMLRGVRGAVQHGS
ncbi:hypothetical protein ABU162_03735 [Paenibacillus thiaminolyticus]|uniref:hypothetical protein n=1 Tax=Paenibacillus thiaminolyticus TaxID=49283 RepID=UPI0035A6C1B6